jgi:hypothetical protein
VTTVQGWSEHDYFRASRAARRACEARSEQLTLGLDDGDATRADGFGCGVPIVEPVFGRSHIPPETGSLAHTTGPAATPPSVKRPGQTGADSK